MNSLIRVLSVEKWTHWVDSNGFMEIMEMCLGFAQERLRESEMSAELHQEIRKRDEHLVELRKKEQSLSQALTQLQHCHSSANNQLLQLAKEKVPILHPSFIIK